MGVIIYMPRSRSKTLQNSWYSPQILESYGLHRSGNRPSAERLLLCGGVQVRKAYKKFALRMHPDKAAAACRFGTDLVPGTRLVGDAAAVQVGRCHSSV
jgi:hypothetical protein